MRQGQRCSNSKFNSSIGVILAAVGSAVGMGNIWLFPYRVGQYGGGAFLVPYFLFVALFSYVGLSGEFALGRLTGCGTRGAFDYALQTRGRRGGSLIGILPVLGVLGIAIGYSVVVGWVLNYTVGSLTGAVLTTDAADYFGTLAVSFGSVPWHLIAVTATAVILILGVSAGIEKISKFMMPVFFLLFLIIAVRVAFLPGAAAGYRYLLAPDWSFLRKPETWVMAMGQAFFSLSLGMGCLCTYASYFKKDTNLTKTAFSVSIIDTFVAILAGLIIFPAAFSVGIQPDAGPSLIFITLPNVFQQAFSGVPLLAYIFSVMFYILLAVAALTSTISMHEVVTAYLHEEFHLSRKRAASFVTGGCMFLGTLCSLSLGVGKGYTLFGLNLFDMFDFVTAKIMLPLGGLCISIFTGWYLNKKIVWEEVSNNGTLKVTFYKLLIFILKFIAPIAISLIFIKELGFLKL